MVTTFIHTGPGCSCLNPSCRQRRCNRRGPHDTVNCRIRDRKYRTILEIIGDYLLDLWWRRL